MDFNEEFKEYLPLGFIKAIQIDKMSNILTKSVIITLEGEEL
jgi:hypothetical protein